jgi:uncharacterized protein (DUF1501 family)
MNRREFLKNVGASGMVAVAPMTLATRAAAETELSPVGKYFVFAHLGGGWEPTTFCNPMGNKLRSAVGTELGMDSGQVRNAGSPVNRYPESAIRRAVDIYTGTETISEDLKYAPFLGTFNRTGADGGIDDGNANGGLTTVHIQKILSGDFNAGMTVLTAQADADFEWKVSKTPAEIQATAKLLIESCNTDSFDRSSSITVNLNDIDVDGDDLSNDFNDGSVNANFFVYDAFVCLHADKMRILNGVDNRTNSHSTGTQYADTGSMAMGYPDFSALYAAVHGSDRPLAWMTDGSGNDATAGLVARSSAADANVFNILADPKRNSTGQGMTRQFEAFLSRANDLRASLQKETDNLPIRRQYQDELYLVRNQGDEFVTVAGEINNPTSAPKIAVKATADAGNGRQRHIRVGAAGFESGLASSMQIGFGGFDTHGNHDANHYPRIRQVLTDLHFLFTALEAHGVADQTTVVVGSDFGRTPWYNDGDGKDHWAVTSYMLFGNGVNGGTSVNATNGLVEALNVDSNTMSVTNGGTRMTASHVHRELRKFAGIDQHELSLQFPVEAEDMSILG